MNRRFYPWIALLALWLGSPAYAGSASLPQHLGIGLGNNASSQLAYMTTTTAGTPWDYTTTYDVLADNTQFALNYAQNSFNAGYIPVITEYSIGGQTWGSPGGGLFTTSGLQSTSNMNTYYTTFVARLAAINQVLNGSFDNNRVNANITLSGSNLVATQNANTGTDYATFGVTSHKSGKWSARFTATTKAGATGIGLATSTAASTNYCGFNTLSICWFSTGIVNTNNATVTTIQTFAQGDLIEEAVDLGAQKVWFKDVTAASGWNNDVIGNQNPDTGAGGISISGLASTTLFAAIDTKTINDAITADFTTSAGLATYVPWNDPSGRPGPPVIQIEPDLIGFMQQNYGDSAGSVPVSVASSGYAAVAGYANTAAGFFQALVALRNANAPGALIALHVSPWGPSNAPCTGAGCHFTLPNGNVPDPTNNGSATAAHVVAFINSIGATYDLLTHDISDADAGYKVVIRGNPAANAWWTAQSFTLWAAYLDAIHDSTKLHGILWQTPVGNTTFLTDNNTNNGTSGHYQSNEVQNYLNPANNYALARRFANAGILGILFSKGQTLATDIYDTAADGITNPSACMGTTCNPFGFLNSATSTVSDDDGGLLRTLAAAYYTAGAIPSCP